MGAGSICVSNIKLLLFLLPLELLFNAQAIGEALSTLCLKKCLPILASLLEEVRVRQVLDRAPEAVVALHEGILQVNAVRL